jgi:[acyl-carrier-protein] S-malonyltransferase
LYEKFPVVKETIDKSGDEIKNIIFEGPEEKLKETKYAQPAIFTVSVAIFEALKSLININNFEIITAGHSLGEYSALCVSGFFDVEKGLNLVKARGHFIQEASLANPGAMAAIIGMKKEDVIDLCKQAAQEGICEPVNFNSPGQIVISGTTNSINNAIELAKTKGALKAVMLNVSGPFHSSLMKPASVKMKTELEKYNFSEPKYSIITNCDAQITKDISSIKEKLVKQVCSPVLWDVSMNNAISNGFDTFIEIGPGRVLSGLMRRIDKTKKTLNISDVISLEKVVEELNK